MCFIFWFQNCKSTFNLKVINQLSFGLFKLSNINYSLSESLVKLVPHPILNYGREKAKTFIFPGPRHIGESRVKEAIFSPGNFYFNCLYQCYCTLIQMMIYFLKFYLLEFKLWSFTCEVSAANTAQSHSVATSDAVITPAKVL